MINKEDGRGLSKFLFGSNFFWLVFGLLLLIVWLSSCSTLEKKIEKAKIVAIENPDSFASLCAKLYPPKDSIGTPVIKYIPAPNIDYLPKVDSLLEVVNELKIRNDKDSSEIGKKYRGDINSLYNQVKELKKGYKKCLPDTVTKEITVYRENTAKIKSLELELEASRVSLAIEKDKRLEAEDKAKTRMWWLIGIAGLAAVYVGLKIGKIIPF